MMPAMTETHTVVINRADQPIGGWDSPLTCPSPDGGTRYVCFDYPVGERVEIQAKYLGWTLKLEAEGFTFEDGAREATLEAGRTYTIIADPEAPPLTQDELRRAYRLAMSALEHNGWMPPWVRAAIDDDEVLESRYDEPWRWLTVELGRPEHTHELVGKMVSNASCYADRRATWQAHYADYASRQTPTPITDSTGLRLALDEDRVVLVAYFRALDRFPGGNADMHVVKYTLRVADGPRLSANHWASWDGQHSKNDTPLELAAPELAALSERVLEPLVALFEAEAPERQSIELADAYTDEYELEAAWSSVELLVYGQPDPDAVPRAGMLGYPEDAVEQGPLLFRVHLQTSEDPSQSRDHAPARALLDGLREVLGVADAGTFAAGECEASQALREVERGNWDGCFDWPYVTPMYLHDCKL